MLKRLFGKLLRWEKQNELQAILQELMKTAHLSEMPRRIDLCRKALTRIDRGQDVEVWATLQGELANSLLNNLQGSRVDNIEQAIYHYRQSLEVHTPANFPEQWAATQNNLAMLYIEWSKGERADNIELAIHYAKQGLEVATPTTSSELWAMTHINLAIAHAERIKGERADNIELAIHHAQRSLEVFTLTAYPRQWAIAQNVLTVAHRNRIKGERADNIELAIHHAQRSLEVFTPFTFPEDWAGMQMNLANAYYSRIKGERADNIELAIHHAQRSLEVFTLAAYPELWARSQNTLGLVYADRVRGKRVKNLEQAIYHYQQSLEIYTLDLFPSEHRRTQRNLGNLYFAESRWDETTVAYQAAMEAGRILLETSYTEIGRQAEVHETAQLYARTAYCQLKLGQYEAALVTLDSGKTRLLAQALVMDESNLAQLPISQQEAIRHHRETIAELEAEMRLPQDSSVLYSDRELVGTLRGARRSLRQAIETIHQENPDFMPDSLSLTELLALIPVGGALIALVVTAQGGAVLVIPHGVSAISEKFIVWLGRVQDEMMQSYLIGTEDEPGWLRVYLTYRAVQNWQQFTEDLQHNEISLDDIAIEKKTLEEAWGNIILTTIDQFQLMLINPIIAKLNELGVDSGSPVLLMPQGGLGLLPLHALLLEQYNVTMVPSGYALQTSQKRLGYQDLNQAPTLTAIVNPTADLDFISVEREAIIAHFEADQVTILREQEANMTAVQAALQRQRDTPSIFHFSGHGAYNWDDPLQSGLDLADKRLTLADLIGGSVLQNTRLVVLSACETGMTDIHQSPDEFIGLPAGFLQAGAPGVVSTLWAVSELTTALLVGQFYRYHLEGRLSPAQALRQAQLWLRDLTLGEMVAYIEEQMARVFTSDAYLYFQLAGEKERLMKTYGPDETSCPFAHPYYWAAFTFTGV